jgi:hypothetical protein
MLAMWWLGVALAAEPDPVAAADLPARAEALRKAGVKPEEVKEALRAVREAGLPASEARDVLDESADAVEENGSVDNFGAFVREQVRAGKRGQELAEAIHAEHRERGMGKGHGKGPPEGRGPDGEKGPPDEKGRKGPGGVERPADGKERARDGGGGQPPEGRGPGSGGQGRNKGGKGKGGRE